MKDHVKNVCKMGQRNECCRYLTIGSGGFECAKHTSLKSVLDIRVATETIVARGDNCEGKNVEDLND